jgi:hypothetical protein
MKRTFARAGALAAFAASAILLSAPRAAAQAAKDDPLSLSLADLRILQAGDSGYHLYIRAKPGLGSVLLTESTKDPAMKLPNYAYRSKEPNEVNEWRKRMLNGKFIPESEKVYSIIDSESEPDAEFGRAFHLFIPYVLAFGNQWNRSGELFAADGTFLNIRAFAKPYADYTGNKWKDNPYRIQVTQKALPGPAEGNFMKDTVDNFTDLSGNLVYSTGEKDLVAKIKEIMGRDKGKPLDLVLCLDTTESMANDMAEVKKSLVPMIRELLPEYPGFRLGLVFYKDYFEEYVVKRFDFTQDLDEVQKRIDSVRAWGGRDIPEAVNEALYASITEYEWKLEKKRVILVGDAPAHPLPRGEVKEADVKAAAAAAGVEITAIILPQ